MPKKLRRRKGKYSVPSSKKKDRISRPPAIVQQQAVTQAKKPAPAVTPSTSTIKPATTQYPYIAAELRTISILAVIIIIILFVLAFIPLPW